MAGEETKEDSAKVEETKEDSVNVEERAFQTEVQQVLQILIHSLYTKSEVFLREILSNASDALDKIRFRSLTDRNIVDPDAELEIHVDINADAKTITIKDSGIGMTRDEVNENIGTIAHSGSAEFAQKLSEAKDEEAKLQLIGQFGVGFYSVFMVADRVVLTSRSADPDAQGVLWESTGDGAYTLADDDKAERGTQIQLFLRQDAEEYLNAHRLEQIVRTHSDYISYPIKVAGKQANSASVLWTRPRNEITDEQYNEFYTHLTNDTEAPLAREHAVVDMPIQFYTILFIPKQSPMELLFSQEPKISLNLHVKRIFIQDDCKELLPLYLRFVRGVVDCDDLPLNVSRETLQQNPIIAKIRTNLVRRCLNMLDAMAKNQPDDYKTFWKSFGAVLKEGVHMDYENREQLAKLFLFGSSLESDPEALVSLQTYIDRAQSDQEVIYYLTGENRQGIEQSPLLDAFRERDLEVLYMTDPVDEWVVEALQEFDGKKFQAIDAEEVELKETPKIEGVDDESKEQTIELVSFLKKELEERVADVRESTRLADSPCALVTPKGSMSQNMERLMRMTDRDFTSAKRILEVNPKHAVIRNMGALLKKERDSAQLKEWSGFLIDFVLLGEGKVEEPQRILKTLQSIMGAATQHALKED